MEVRPAKKQKKEVSHEVGTWGHLISTTKAKDLAREQHPKLVVLNAKHQFKEALEVRRFLKSKSPAPCKK